MLKQCAGNYQSSRVLGISKIHQENSFLTALLNRKKTPCSQNVANIRNNSTSANDDYQYIQRSKVPTMHFQKSLPRLPIPELAKTCDRYLSAIRPLVHIDQFKKTETIVEKFKSGEGKNLHEELVRLDKKNKHTSYISGPWFDMYLKARESIVLNYNPALVFKMDPKDEYNDQVIRATNLTISSLRFMKSLRSNILEPEVYHLDPEKSDNEKYRTITRMSPEMFAWYVSYWFKAFPLDMSQYKNLMNSTRIPKIGKDEIRLDNSGRHLVVIKNGNIYSFDALDKNGDILPAKEIYGQIKYIADQATPLPSHSVGYLSTQNRDVWANARSHLEATGNQETLKTIDSAIFVLVLDEEKGKTDFLKMAPSYLHGPAHSRWFDKSFQLIVNRDGVAGINFEHSWGDGVAILRYFNDVFTDSTNKPRIHPDTIPSSSLAIRKLDFKLDDKSKASIDQAKTNYENTVNSLMFDASLNSKFTRDFLKSQKISPDAVIQLSFQLAYQLRYGCKVATYEACSTAAFKHGRTETVRPITMETNAFVEAITKPLSARKSDLELRALIEQCSKAHGNLTKEAAMGQGFDRHLFGLKDLAIKQNLPLPALFQDPTYSHGTHYCMSTSTLYGSNFIGGGFGPVVPDGLGIAYSFTEPWALGILVTGYKNQKNPSEFLSALDKAVDDIYNVLEATKKSK